MVKLQAKKECGFNYGGCHCGITYRLFTENGTRTLYEIDAYDEGGFSLDWDDRFMLAKIPCYERKFETLSDAVICAERHLEKLRNADKVFKLNLGYYFPLCIDEEEARLFTDGFTNSYWEVKNPWKNIA